MDEFNFDKLKNIEVPESWIENALNSPKEKRRYVIPRRFYYFAASAAACLIIGTAVIFSLMFGINKDISLTALDPQSPSNADLVVEQNTVTDSSTPSTAPSKKSGAEAQISTSLTEPSENSAETKEKTATTKSKEPNKQNTAKPGSKANQKPTEPDKTEAQTNAVETETQETQKPVPKPTDSHQGEASLDFYFMANVDSKAALGSIYCRIEDENGVVSKGRALKYDYETEENETRLTYIKYLKLTVGMPYTVVFYNSQGTVIAQGTVVIGNSSDYWI